MSINRGSLEQGAIALGLTLSQEQIDQLTLYVERLQQWSKALNLTAIKDSDKVLTHHLLDSLAVAPYLSGERILDLGTGAGLPGVPLAITFPQKNFILLDSVGKKVHFLTQVLVELKCQNAKAVQERAENFSAVAPFDVIICRAVSAANDIIRYSKHLMTDKGKWFLMKGPGYQNELTRLNYPFRVESLKIPGMDAERYLVIVDNSKE